MSKRIRRDPKLQAQLMIEGFGKEKARVIALDGQRDTSGETANWWAAVLSNIPPPIEEVQKNAEMWAAARGLTYCLDKVGEHDDDLALVIPIRQRTFGHILR